jgi:hypothetical protein
MKGSTRAATLVRRRLRCSDDAGAQLQHVPAFVLSVPLSGPFFDTQYQFVKGDEALGRIAMMQFSLQFMLWQQHRRRWEGIIASAMAHLEGFEDLDRLQTGAPPPHHQDLDLPSTSADLTMGAGVNQNKANSKANNASNNVGDSPSEVSTPTQRSIGTVPLKDDVASLHFTVELPYRAPQIHEPHIQKSQTIEVSFTSDNLLKGTVEIPSSKLERTSVEVSPSTNTQSAAIAAEEILPRMSTNKINKVDHSSDGLTAASSFIETRFASNTTLLGKHTSSPRLQRSAIEIASRLDAALFAGVFLSTEHGRSAVRLLLVSSGGYHEVMRRRRLFACELGLGSFVANCTSEWRQEHHTHHNGTTRNERLTVPTPARRDKKTLVDALARCTAWGDEAVAVWEALVSLDPFAATDVLEVLASRFGPTVRRHPAVIRRVGAWASEGQTQKAGTPVSPPDKKSKFQRARQHQNR